MRLIDVDTIPDIKFLVCDATSANGELDAYCRGMDKVMEVVKSMPTIEVPQWIPCSKRLPEEKAEHYWVCLDSGGQCQCRWTNDRFCLGANKWNEWGWSIMDKPMYTKIVAWMPLPEPYQEGADE